MFHRFLISPYTLLTRTSRRWDGPTDMHHDIYEHRRRRWRRRRNLRNKFLGTCFLLRIGPFRIVFKKNFRRGDLRARIPYRTGQNFGGQNRRKSDLLPKTLSAEILTCQIKENLYVITYFVWIVWGIKKPMKKIWSDKTAKISTWCHKFCPPKFCPI